MNAFILLFIARFLGTPDTEGSNMSGLSCSSDNEQEDNRTDHMQVSDKKDEKMLVTRFSGNHFNMILCMNPGTVSPQGSLFERKSLPLARGYESCSFLLETSVAYGHLCTSSNNGHKPKRHSS